MLQLCIIYPSLSGIGWATTAIIFFVNCYYEVILAWAFFYFFSSFTTNLPWDTCNNAWNTNKCNKKYFVDSKSPPQSIHIDNYNNESGWFANVSVAESNYSETFALVNTTTTKAAPLRIDPVTEFWE